MEPDLTSEAHDLKTALDASRRNSKKMMSILRSFDKRLAGLEQQMRPVQARTHKVRVVHKNIDSLISAAKTVLDEYDASRQVEDVIKCAHADEHALFYALHRLKQAISFFKAHSSFKGADQAQKYAQGLFEEGFMKAKKEFSAILHEIEFEVVEEQDERIPKEGPQEMTLMISADRWTSLTYLTNELLGLGKLEDCMKEYRLARMQKIGEVSRWHGIVDVSKETISAVGLKELEAAISSWGQHFQGTVSRAFLAEKELACEVFYKESGKVDEVFASVLEVSLRRMMDFPHAVSNLRRTPDRIFCFLDMYEALVQVLLQMQDLFGNGTGSWVCHEGKSLLQKLAVAVCDSCKLFEGAVGADSSLQVGSDGNVHPLTSYVLNHMKFLLDYKETLVEVFESTHTASRNLGATSLKSLCINILDNLVSNLHVKSRNLKDPALSQVFLMNNLIYISSNAARYGVIETTGSEWCAKQRREADNHAASYLRLAWEKMSACIQQENPQSAPKLNRTAVKERLSTFNSLFEATCEKQKKWVVPDPNMRQHLRSSIKQFLLPAYQSFLINLRGIDGLHGKRSGGIVKDTLKKYIRYSVEDIESSLASLFYGNSAS